MSLRNQNPKDESNPTKAEAQTPIQQDISHDDRRAGPEIHYTPVGNPQIPRGVGRYSRHVRDDIDARTKPPPAISDSVERIEEEQRGLKEDPKARTSYARSIEEALSKGRIDQAWKVFEENYTSIDCKALTEPSLSDVALLNQGKVFLRLLNAVNRAFCKGDTNLAITPTVVLFRYEQLGIIRPNYWAKETLAYLTFHVIQAANTSTNKPQRDLPSLLSELLSVWRLFFQCKGSKGDPLKTISTEWHLPDTQSLPEVYESKNFSMRLQEYHPKYVGDPMLAFCAVYLYSISDAINSVESLQQQAAPLLKFFEQLLAGSYIDFIKRTQYWRSFSQLPTETQEQIKKEIYAAPRNALVMIGAKGETLGAENTGDAASNLEAFYLKRIARAVESRTSPSLLNSLWTQVEKAYTAKGQDVAIPPRIYNAFLSGYMVLLTSQRSVEVWNHMIAHGVKPDMQSWVALLDGCAKAKDLDGFNAMWTRMLNTGVEPDNYAWTTRVNGLFALRQVNLALAALDEMGKRWLSAETVIDNPQTHGKSRAGTKNLPKSAKAVNNCTKPSIEVVNGAVSAIVRIRPESMRHDKRVEFIQKILGWASNFQVQANTHTYNSLIQLYLGAGDYATAFKVLRQMEKDGVQGDIATHTMLINAAFDNQVFDNLSESEQTERILALFSDLESSGMKLNDYVYATAINRFLKQYSNYSAVRAMIDHMTSRNLVPSAHVYTSLITSYFQQQPPAIPAIDSLVLQIFTSHRMPNDRIMFDRLIEGYAEHGEVGKMMSVLTRMSKHGKVPGWRALTVVVQALAKDGDMERATAIVRDVERVEGIAQGGITGGAKGENAFFRLVRELGISLEEKTSQVLSQDGNMQTSGDDAVGGQELLQRSEAQQHVGSPSEREPASVPGDREEDVHGFLTDEPEPEYQHARKP